MTKYGGYAMRRVVNILHLSDLHFGYKNEAAGARNNKQLMLDGLVSIFGTLDRALMPDIVLLSGDIGWSGKGAEYREAAKWIEKLLTKLGLKKACVAMCPGNHDISRKKASRLKAPDSPEEADGKFSGEGFVELGRPFSDFSAFCEELGLKKYRLGGEYSYLAGCREMAGINVMALNSAWFSYSDRDKGRLFVGMPLIEKMKGKGQLIDNESYDEERITVAIMHHPAEWLDDSERVSYRNRAITYEYLAKHCHIILSGHTHNEKIVSPDIKFNRALVFSGGAVYSSHGLWHNFSIIQVDADSRKVKRTSFEYDNRYGEWKRVDDDSIYDIVRKDKAAEARGADHLRRDILMLLFEMESDGRSVCTKEYMADCLGESVMKVEMYVKGLIRAKYVYEVNVVSGPGYFTFGTRSFKGYSLTEGGKRYALSHGDA